MSDKLSQETIETIIRYLQADKSHSALLCRSLAEEQRSRLPILPPEIIDMIIDDLHEDKITLAACSLVCRGWLSASRHHLFSRIMLSPLRWSRIRPLLDLSGGMSNTIAMSVQHLVLCNFPESAPVGLIQDITSHLRLVKLLSFDSLSFKYVRQGYLEIISRNLGGVEMLKIDTDTLTAADVRDIFPLFPALRLLCLKYRCWCSTSVHSAVQLIQHYGIEMPIIDLTSSTGMWLTLPTNSDLVAGDLVCVIPNRLLCFAYLERFRRLPTFLMGAGKCIERIEISLNSFPPHADIG